MSMSSAGPSDRDAPSAKEAAAVSGVGVEEKRLAGASGEELAGGAVLCPGYDAFVKLERETHRQGQPTRNQPDQPLPPPPQPPPPPSLRFACR